MGGAAEAGPHETGVEGAAAPCVGDGSAERGSEEDAGVRATTSCEGGDFAERGLEEDVSARATTSCGGGDSAERPPPPAMSNEEIVRRMAVWLPGCVKVKLYSSSEVFEYVTL